MQHGDALIEIREVTKDYQGLRPLRVAELTVREGQSLALVGFDLAMAEVLVNLITGATLPDTGTVRVFGQPTTAITNADAWVDTLDRFGLISERALLVDRFTAEQNLALPLSLEIEDISASLRTNVHRLAAEVGLPVDELPRPTGSLSAASQLRIRLGRALALGPRVLLAEHPNALTSAEDAPRFATDYANVIGLRQLASLVLTADQSFAKAVTSEVFTLQPASGILTASTGWRRWFS
jgi:predicted ABC-type transport system involved in lysophospholipase L1 biosynthesis ATPase subunit